MTISELIERLEALKAEHGHKVVYVGHDCGMGEVEAVYLSGDDVVIEDA